MLLSDVRDEQFTNSDSEFLSPLHHDFRNITCKKFSDPTSSIKIESGLHFVEVEDEIFSLFNPAKIIDEENFLVSIIWKFDHFDESCH